jgi:hypothetical protein
MQAEAEARRRLHINKSFFAAFVRNRPKDKAEQKNYHKVILANICRTSSAYPGTTLGSFFKAWH